MIKETETEETLGYVIFLFLSLVAFQLGGRVPCPPPWLRLWVTVMIVLLALIAKKKISCIGSSTSGLFRLWKSKHYLSLESEENQPCFSRKAKI